MRQATQERSTLDRKMFELDPSDVHAAQALSGAAAATQPATEKAIALHPSVAEHAPGRYSSRAVRLRGPADALVPRSERVPAEIDVMLWVNSKVHDTARRRGNGSEDAMFVVTSKPLPVGTVARFQMTLPNGEVVSGFAEVAWIRRHYEHASRPNGMGVRYTVVRADGRRLLREFVLENLESSNNARVVVREVSL